MPDDRFADRDMLMRYHWGLGIGHVYAHEAKLPQDSATPDGKADDTNMLDDEESADAQHQAVTLGEDFQDANVLDDEESADTQHQAVTLGEDIQDPDFEHGNGDSPELGMGIQDEDEDEFIGQSDSDLESESWDDEECLELMETYYTNY